MKTGESAPDIVDELEKYAHKAMPHYPNDVCSRARREILSLRSCERESALTSAILLIHVLRGGEKAGLDEAEAAFEDAMSKLREPWPDGRRTDPGEDRVLSKSDP